MEELGKNGGVVLETRGDDVGMNLLKPLKAVATLQEVQDSFGL